MQLISCILWIKLSDQSLHMILDLGLLFLMDGIIHLIEDIKCVLTHDLFLLGDSQVWNDDNGHDVKDYHCHYYN